MLATITKEPVEAHQSIIYLRGLIIESTQVDALEDYNVSFDKN